MIEFKLETHAAGPDGSSAVSIIGIGGAGSNVLDHIALEGMDGVELISMNCDARSLTTSMAQRKVQLGKTLTQGLGCGGDPELGQEAAVGSLEDIREALTGRRMIFLCVGLGGGTGSGAAPIVARLARESGAFVIVFATMPFVFEGKRRMKQAQSALDEIRQHANALVCFENDKMGELVLAKKGVAEAFEVADRMICQSVRAVTTVATQPGLIRIGMDDLVTALKNADSRCLFGFGQAKGEARAAEALQAALKSPLLDRGQLLEKARNVLVHICGGTSLTLFEIETLMKELSKHVSEEAQILFGAASDVKLGDTLSVTIISSLGKGRAVPAAEPAAQSAVAPVRPVPAAPSPAPAQQTQTVPILSVQPRQAPQSPPANMVAPAPVTVTIDTSSVPVLKMTAQVAPPRPVKPVRQAPMTPPAVVEPDLFEANHATAPANPPPVQKSVVPAVAVQPVVAALEPAAKAEEPISKEEPVAVNAVVSSIPAPVIPEKTEIVFEEEIIEEEIIVEEMPEEEEPVMEEQEFEEEIAAREREIEEKFVVEEMPEPIGMEEEQPEELAAVVEPHAEEEEYEMEEEEPEVVPPPVISQERPPRPAPAIRPIEIPAPSVPTGPAKKFDLREILQRQRQTRLGQRRQLQSPEPVKETPVRPAAPPQPAPATDRTPNPDRISPIRPIPAARTASPFIATRPPATPTPGVRHASPSHAQQATFDERLSPAARSGRFEKAEPTVEEGEDLDIPTFLRKKR